jgi:hypothetical protein
VLNRRLASLLAAATVAGLAATACGQQVAAVRVDDNSLSRSDFEDELEVYYENDQLRAAVLGDQTPQEQLRGELRGSYSQDFVGVVAGQEVLFLLADNVREDEGVELTDADRAGVREQLDQVPGAGSLPEEFRDRLIDDVAGYTKLQNELGQEAFADALNTAVASSTIEVSSQYGTWDPDEFMVRPPDGPEPAPGTADGTAGLTPG